MYMCVHTFLALGIMRNSAIQVSAFHAINFLQAKAGAKGNHWASVLSKYPSPDVGQSNGNNDTRSIKQNPDLLLLACLKFLFLSGWFAQDLSCFPSGKEKAVKHSTGKDRSQC